MIDSIRHRYIYYLLIAFTIYNLFFINKAIHIDDPYTIYITEGINKNFYFPPLGFSNPPFLGYYYLLLLKFFSFGEKEIIFHIFSLPFSLVSIISMYLLAIRFIKNGQKLLPVLFLISTPAFIITSHSIMLDIPLLAFSLSALTAFIYGTDKEDNSLLLLSSALTSIAILIKYSGLLLIPILSIYSVLFSRKKNLIFLIIPLGIFILWNIYMVFFYGQFIFFAALLQKLKNFFTMEQVFIRILACLTFISGASIITLFFVPYLLKDKVNKRLLLLAFPFSLWLLSMGKIFFEYSLFEKTILFILVINTLFIIFVVAKSGLCFLNKNKEEYIHIKDNLFLSFWFFLTLLFTILIQFIAARFVLLLFPPLFLIIYNEITSIDNISAKKMFILPIIACSLISTIVAIGDYNFAGIYRKSIGHLKKTYSEKTNVFLFLSADWGYNYYVYRMGYRFLTKSLLQDREALEKLLKRNNVLLIVPNEQPLPYFESRERMLKTLLEGGYDKILIDKTEYKGYIFSHNKRFHAGFYSHDWGLLPFYISMQKVPLEGFEIYKLVSSLEGGS